MGKDRNPSGCSLLLTLSRVVEAVEAESFVGFGPN